MANLVIDIGNTRTKIAVFKNREHIKTDVHESVTPELIDQYLSAENINNSIITSVNQEIYKLEDVLKAKTHYTYFSGKHSGSIINHYKSPQTFGLDRLAGLIGAQALYPHSNNLVIDAGTAITYDAHDSDGNYYGGSISPGLHMRLKALHTFTGRLPLVMPDENFNGWMGDDTPKAILSGVVQGMINEISGFIEIYQQEYGQLNVILSGGDADFFDTRLKNSIFAHILKIRPHLVLTGLNEVINQQND